MIEPLPSRQLREFDDLADELDFMFSQYFPGRRPVLMPVEKGWKPPTDVYETASEVVVVFDLAGVKPRDITATVEGGHLVLRGIRREYGVGEKRQYYKMEIDFGVFKRHIELPAAVDSNNTKTNYRDGFLEIRLPKKQGAGSVNVQIEIK